MKHDPDPALTTTILMGLAVLALVALEHLKPWSYYLVFAWWVWCSGCGVGS